MRKGIRMREGIKLPLSFPRLTVTSGGLPVSYNNYCWV